VAEGRAIQKRARAVRAFVRLYFIATAAAAVVVVVVRRPLLLLKRIVHACGHYLLCFLVQVLYRRGCPC
jgi:hypothetical protein